ncbi:MAG: twin-arginine translocase TatA/TatE family subunit [Bacteroidales bacterium]|nr:twin-arginine translocase TatA/TatE family subunit [Bacteroidales bacterium]
MKLLFLGTWEIILIVLVVLLLFGGKKIPELMRGIGKGVKSFKDGVNGVEDEKTSSHQDIESSRHNDTNTENSKS